MQSFKYLLCAAAIVSYVLYFYLDAISAKVKYEAPADKFYVGVSYSNIMIISARSFFAAAAILYSVMIELNFVNVNEILATALLICVISAMSIKRLLNFQFQEHLYQSFSYKTILDFFKSDYPDYNREESNDFPRLTGVFVSISIFLNIAAALFIYYLCAAFPSYRMSLLSFSPLISMLGTLYITFLFEPYVSNKLSKLGNFGFVAARFLLNARLNSLSCAAFLIVLIYLIN